MKATFAIVPIGNGFYTSYTIEKTEGGKVFVLSHKTTDVPHQMTKAYADAALAKLESGYVQIAYFECWIERKTVTQGKPLYHTLAHRERPAFHTSRSYRPTHGGYPG